MTPSSYAVDPLPCSTASADAGEPLHGTAVAATTAWLLLEVRQPWGPRGFEDAVLPAQVKEHLDHALKVVPGTRPQLIRPGPGVRGTGFTFMVAVSNEAETKIHRHRLDRLDDLLDLDVVSLLRGRGPSDEAEKGPLVLACTHGRRDRCCARLGVPLAQTLMNGGAIEVWQTTHLGGHRFAPTLVFLPDGVAYGRLQLGEVPSLVSAHLAGRIEHLHRFRGRTFYSSAAQAADYFVRRHTGFSNLDGLQLRTIREQAEHTVVEAQLRDRDSFLVQMVRQDLPTALSKSCGARAEPVHYYAVESVTSR